MMTESVWRRVDTNLYAILVIAAGITLALFTGVDGVVTWVLLSVVATLLWAFWTAVFGIVDRVSGVVG